MVRRWENHGRDATHVYRLRQTEQRDFFLSVVEKSHRLLGGNKMYVKCLFSRVLIMAGVCALVFMVLFVGLDFCGLFGVIGEFGERVGAQAVSRRI